MGEKEIVLELIEEYIVNGEHRFKLRIKGTNFVINVAADSLDEAVRKAAPIIKSIKSHGGAAGI